MQDGRSIAATGAIPNMRFQELYALEAAAVQNGFLKGIALFAGLLGWDILEFVTLEQLYFSKCLVTEVPRGKCVAS